MTVKWTTPSQPSNLAARRPKGPYPQKAATPMVRCGAPGSSTGGRRPPPLLSSCAHQVPPPSRSHRARHIATTPDHPPPAPKSEQLPFSHPRAQAVPVILPVNSTCHMTCVPSLFDYGGALTGLHAGVCCAERWYNF
nr:uncharacterized protein LOC127295431 [Lolium perenne]